MNLDTFVAIFSAAAASSAAFAAWQSKKSTEELVKSRLAEIQPVLKNQTFSFDVNKKEIIVNVQCKGRGSMYNLRLVSPTERFIQYVVEVNTALQRDFRIESIKKDFIIFEYEDIFGNMYESKAEVKNNSLISDYRQRKVEKGGE